MEKHENYSHLNPTRLCYLCDNCNRGRYYGCSLIYENKESEETLVKDGKCSIYKAGNFRVPQWVKDDNERRDRNPLHGSTPGGGHW